MNGRILVYTLLALVWAGLALAIFFGAHEGWLGRADEWKRYLAMGLCGLMCVWNLLRIFVLRQARRPRPDPYDFSR